MAGYVRFEVFTAVTMKNGVFWVVTPHGVTTQNTPFFMAGYIPVENFMQMVATEMSKTWKP
jgi:hypothetical protein